MTTIHDFLLFSLPSNESVQAELIVKSSKGTFKLTGISLMEACASEDEMTLICSAHNDSVKIEKLIG